MNKRKDLVLRIIINVVMLGFLLYILIDCEKTKQNFFEVTKDYYYLYLLYCIANAQQIHSSFKLNCSKSIKRRMMYQDLLVLASLIATWFVNIYDFWLPILAFFIDVILVRHDRNNNHRNM